MATNVLPPLSLSGEGRAQKLSPAGARHPRAKHILTESKLMSLQALREPSHEVSARSGSLDTLSSLLVAEPSSLRSSGRPTHRGLANVKEKQQKRALFKDINPAR